MKTIKLKYRGQYLDNILAGTSLYEISKHVKDDFKYDIVGAKYNNQICDLSKEINNDGEVEFYDRSTSLGNRIYARSLEFLTIVSGYEVLDDNADILINYSLDSGIYCEVTGQNLTPRLAGLIEEKMHELVNARLPYTKSVVSRFDAINYFEKAGRLDKVNSLNYISNSTVNLYKLNGIYDYFFGTLAYDTSQLNKFDITYLGHNLFVVNYPSQKKPSVISEYKEHEKLVAKYQEYKKWGEALDMDMVSDLNKIGISGNYNDIVRLFETHYEEELSNVAEMISKRKNVKLILIAGPSSSGKTTTSKKLALYLRVKGLVPHQISLDDYFIDRDKTPKDKNGNYDFANIKATDIDLFNKHLKSLLAGETVLLPNFDFISGKRVYKNSYLTLGPNDVLIVEGIHTLNDIVTKSIPVENKFKIYMSPLVALKIDNHNRVHPTDVRKIRRIVRDNKFRGVGAENTLKIWPNVDKEAAENIYPYQDNADAIINSALTYEMSVLRIFAEPLLYGIDSDSEVYAEAIRLINLLRNFMPITSEIVPRDSLLREFIGGGIYN